MFLSYIRSNKEFENPAVVLTVLLLSIFSYSYARASIDLHNVTKETGITFKHTDGSSGRRYIVENFGAGLATFDYDNDGDIDIYFLNGALLKETRVKNVPKNALYRNDGNWKFTDVTKESGLGDAGYGLGVAVGDYDNDGYLDVYVNNFGPNVLYRNNSDGTFSDVTKKTGVENGSQFGAGANFLDMDKDGDLDLFVSNYVEYSYEIDAEPFIKDGHHEYRGPHSFKETPDALFCNNGDGTFTDVSKQPGVATHPGNGMGTVCADYDNDGDTDIFVANDQGENFLFKNDGSGQFEEVSLLAGVACDYQGTMQGSMGVDCGDYDNDGLLDFYLTSYQLEVAVLYRNLGDGMFEDVTTVTRAGAGTLNNLTWGNGFADFDNDGDRDIFVALGHLQDNIEIWDDTTSFYARNVLLMNTGDGKFVNVSEKSGDGLQVKLSSRGAAFNDLDNDGDIDVVILNTRCEPTIIKNDTANGNHWLQIRLHGTTTNRDGIGAHVKVTAGDLSLIDEVHSGRGYQGHHSLRLQFGLRKYKKIDRIEVQWIGGGIDVFKDIAADQSIILTEGSSKKAQNS